MTQGQVALVDDEDFERVNAFAWHARQSPSGLWYAIRNIWVSGENRNDHQTLHHFIAGYRGVDHRDGDGLNNQKQNLRPATKSQNAMGFRRKGKSATSRFRGVYWETQTQKWRARIFVAGKSILLGRHTSDEAAARKYDEAARKHFGEFASPNFPNES